MKTRINFKKDHKSFVIAGIGFYLIFYKDQYQSLQVFNSPVGKAFDFGAFEIGLIYK